MQPNIDAPTGDADHVVLRALPVSQLRPTAASAEPQCPVPDLQGPRGFVLSVPDAVTVRLISWTLKELWNNQSASAIPTKSRNTSRSLR